MHHVHRAEQVGNLVLDPRGDILRFAGGTPHDAGERHTALLSLHQQFSQELGIGGPVEGDAAGHLCRQLVESGDQPGSARVLIARRRGRHLMPAEGVEQSRGVATEAAHQRLARCALDGELTDSPEHPAIEIDEIEVEGLGFAGQFAGVPLRPAIETAGHPLADRDLPVPQGQEQVVDALFGGQQRWERGESDAGAQVHHHRVHRLAAEILGEFFADHNVANGFAVAEPQRLQRARPGRPPGQLHIGEDLKQLLRTHPLAPLDRFVDRIRILRCRLADAIDDGAVSVQRPFGGSIAVRAAVHLETPPAIVFCGVFERMQSQLNLPRMLLGQDDRFVEKDVLHVRRRTDRGERHRGIGSTGNHDGAVDDVVGQPGL